MVYNQDLRQSCCTLIVPTLKWCDNSETRISETAINLWENLWQKHILWYTTYWKHTGIPLGHLPFQISSHAYLPALTSWYSNVFVRMWQLCVFRTLINFILFYDMQLIGTQRSLIGIFILSAAYALPHPDRFKHLGLNSYSDCLFGCLEKIKSVTVFSDTSCMANHRIMS
jgi:hypothetical protein